MLPLCLIAGESALAGPSSDIPLHRKSPLWGEVPMVTPSQFLLQCACVVSLPFAVQEELLYV